MKRILLTIPILMSLSGCLSSEGILTTGAVTAANALGVATGLPYVGLVAGAAAGVGVDYLIEEQKNQLELIPEEDRASAYKSTQFWDTVSELGTTTIFAILAFFLIPMLIGYFIPSPLRRKD